MAALDMLARLAVSRKLLPDAVKNDMARDVLVDVARNIDEVEFGIAFLREENRLVEPPCSRSRNPIRTGKQESF